MYGLSWSSFILLHCWNELNLLWRWEKRIHRICKDQDLEINCSIDSCSICTSSSKALYELRIWGMDQDWWLDRRQLLRIHVESDPINPSQDQLVMVFSSNIHNHVTQLSPHGLVATTYSELAFWKSNWWETFDYLVRYIQLLDYVKLFICDFWWGIWSIDTSCLCLGYILSPHDDHLIWNRFLELRIQDCFSIENYWSNFLDNLNEF